MAESILPPAEYTPSLCLSNNNLNWKCSPDWGLRVFPQEVTATGDIVLAKYKEGSRGG